MEDSGFILASYIVTFIASGLMALWIRRKGKQLAAQLPDQDKPWI
jgi:hypothetical protein